MRSRFRHWFLVLPLLACGCQPTFKPQGSLSIDDATFTPTVCEVLSGTASVTFTDAKGARLELTMPREQLAAYKELSGTPTVRYTANGGSPVDLGACGTLKLTGEAYHSSGKRAASGTLSLACATTVKVKGDLSWSGCF